MAAQLLLVPAWAQQKTAKPAPAQAAKPGEAKADLGADIGKPTGMSKEQIATYPMPVPAFKTAPPEKRRFVMEYDTNYTRVRYAPPVVIQPVPKGADNFTNPEETFVTMFSAMMQADYDRWFSVWTEDSQKVLAQRDAERKRTATDWVGRWKAALTGRQIVLLERLESGPYVMVVYSLRDMPKKGENQGAEIIRNVVTMKKVGEKWRVTEELADDDMYKYYIDSPEGVTRRVR